MEPLGLFAYLPKNGIIARMEGTNRTGRTGPTAWLGFGVRLLATLFLLSLILALGRCGTVASPTTATPTVVAVPAQLEIRVLPEGAQVFVDGLRSGVTPVSIALLPGEHAVRVEMDGYQPLEATVTLSSDGRTVISEELVQKAPANQLAPETSPLPTPTSQAQPTDLQPQPDLVIRDFRIELETAAGCDYDSTQLGIAVTVENVGNADAGPFTVEANGTQQAVHRGLMAGGHIRLWFGGYASGENTTTVDSLLQVEERDEENNVVSQMLPIPTLPPTCTPPEDEAPTSVPSPVPTPLPAATAAPPPPPAGEVTVSEGQVSIPTYPLGGAVTEVWSEGYNMAYQALDRPAFLASEAAPATATFRTLVLENEYLKLTFLPELGGRIYEVIFKPTGHRETYLNPVLKPSPWGPPEQGWWLAAGGIEWGLPVEEHGYEWGIPWEARIEQDAEGATVYLRDTTASDRVRAEIAVRLEAGAGYFTIRPRLENPTGAPLDVKYWTNAMLAPGGPNAPSADLRFVLPDSVSSVTVHSRGDESLPDYNQRMAWPVFNGVDYSKLGNWNRWLGFFEDPAQGEFMAVYDVGYDEGMVRVFPPDTARGAKVFGFGWHDPIASSNWTDDGSSYVELHGGPAPTFDHSVTLPAGGHLQWSETWYPVAGLGGMRSANAKAAMNLSAGGGQAQVAATVTTLFSGDAVLTLNGQEIWRQGVSLVPGQPLRTAVPLGDQVPESGRLVLRLEAPGGAVEAECGAELNLR